MARFTKEEAEALGDLLFYAGKNADEEDAKLYATIADKLDELLIEEGCDHTYSIDSAGQGTCMLCGAEQFGEED